MPSFYKGISAVLMLCLYGVQASETEHLPSSEEPLQPIGFFGTVTGDVELGFLLTSGNTDSFAIRANSELVHELEYFRSRYQLQRLLQYYNVPTARTGDKTQVTSACRQGVTGQSSYNTVYGRQSVFGRGAYLHEKFGAFKEQASLV